MLMAKRKSKTKTPIVKKYALGIIITASVMVAISLILWFYFQPDKVARRELEYLAKDYYETYYYPQSIENADQNTLTKVAENGSPTVKLRQLLLFDNQRHASSAQAFDQKRYFCDTSATYIKYYPVEPFGKKDYKIEYNYTCKNL